MVAADSKRRLLGAEASENVFLGKGDVGIAATCVFLRNAPSLLEARRIVVVLY